MSLMFEVTPSDVILAAKKVGFTLSESEAVNMMDDLDLDFDGHLVHVDSMNEQVEVVLLELGKQIKEIKG